MKKTTQKVISLMLCLLLCTGMFGMLASANGEGSHFHDGIEFQPWTDNSTLPENGNWYLTSDVDILRRVEVSGKLSLCLNGHGISSSGNSCLFYVGPGETLDLYDCGFYAEHKFILSNVAENGSGLAAVDDNLRTGYKTFTGGYITEGRATRGGGIYVNGGTVNMYGGNIIGNYATETKGGAGVFVLDGTFAMHGGSIMYNYASGGMGGGVYIDSNAGKTGTFIMTGGEIAYNQAHGGYNSNNPVYYGDGGGICARNNNSNGRIVCDLTGGEIHHNAALEYGGGVNFTCNNGTLNIGGNMKITDNYGNEGGLRVSVATSAVNFSGSPLIDRNVTKDDQKECNFFINNPPTIKIVGEMTNDIPISVLMKTPGVFTASDDVSFNDTTKFTSEDERYTVVKNGSGQLAVGTAHTVTWKNYDGQVLATETLMEGLVPTYKGDTPVRDDDYDNSYTFKGWTPGITALTADAVYTAEFTAVPHPTTTVTVEFGEGHEDYAQAYCSGVEGLTVSGSTVTYSVPMGLTVSESRSPIYEPIFDGTFSLGRYDNGECFMMSFELQPTENYASRSAVYAEHDEKFYSLITDEGVTFYAQWAKPVGEVTVTVTPPEVGTEIGTTGSPYSALYRSDPPVEATVTGNAYIEATLGNQGNWMTDLEANTYYTGTVAEGQACYASIYLTANYGRFFGYYDENGFHLSEDNVVTVTNDANAVFRGMGSEEYLNVVATVYADSGSSQEHPQMNDDVICKLKMTGIAGIDYIGSTVVPASLFTYELVDDVWTATATVSKDDYIVRYAVTDSMVPDLEVTEETVTFTAEYIDGQWVGQTTFVESQVTEEARGSVWAWLLNALLKLIILIFQGVGA